MERPGQPTVSVIIPAYNSGRYLAEAVESVLAQSYPAVECIVVDDGSTDDTPEIATSFPSVVYLRQENAERSAARNNGVRHASGEYLSFLDADDFIAPTKIADQVAFLLDHTEYQAVYSGVTFFRDEAPGEQIALERIHPEGEILEKLLYGNFITVHAPLLPRSAVQAAGGFDPALSHNEDWDLFLRLALGGVRFGFLDKVHAFCRFHAANTSGDEIRMHEAKLQVAERFVSQHLGELRRRGIPVEAPLAFHEADFGKALIANGKGKEGRARLFGACRQQFPGRWKYLSYGWLSYFLGRRAQARLGAGVYRAGKGPS